MTIVNYDTPPFLICDCLWLSESEHQLDNLRAEQDEDGNYLCQNDAIKETTTNMGDFRLKVFASVAKNLSFTKASQELFISQPSVTKHIQELEAAYQTRLFERKGNSIILTEAGRVFWEYSKRILEGYSRLEYEMSLLRNVHSGELRLGASTTIAQYVLPPLLAHFAERFPQITLNLLSGNSAQIEKALTEHRIDLGLVEGNARQQNLKYTAFMSDELVAVVNTHSRWSKCDEIEPSELC